MKEYIFSNDDLYSVEMRRFEELKELIHCRDCKHRTHNGTCIRMMKKKADEGYCDEGEQRKTCYDRFIEK